VWDRLIAVASVAASIGCTPRGYLIDAATVERQARSPAGPAWIPARAADRGVPVELRASALKGAVIEPRGDQFLARVPERRRIATALLGAGVVLAAGGTLTLLAVALRALGDFVDVFYALDREPAPFAAVDVPAAGCAAMAGGVLLASGIVLAIAGGAIGRQVRSVPSVALQAPRHPRRAPPPPEPTDDRPHHPDEFW
jgi:hypothetical protein